MKKMNKKGFTLIELLAVIIILAVIALIAVPIITNIITKARKSAAVDSAYAVVDAGKLYYSTSLLENPNDAFEEVVFSFPGAASTLELKGTKPTNGTMTVDPDGNVNITDLIISGYECNYKSNSDEIECVVPQP